MFLFITCLAVIANIYLGLIVFLKNPKSATGILFLILTIILALWSVTNYLSLFFQDPKEILFWIRAVMVVTASMFPVLYLLTTAFPGNNLGLGKFKVIIISLFILLTQYLATTDFVFKDVELLNGNANPVPGTGIFIVAINFIGFLILTLITLFIKYKRVKALTKTQLKYLMFGIALTFIAGVITNFIFVVILKNTLFVSLGPLFSLILVASIAYAIIKHRFYDIRLVVAKTVSYLLLVLVAAVFYAGGFFLIGTFFIKQPTLSVNLITSTILALFIAFSFQSFLRFFERLTDHIFFKDHYDSQVLLRNLNKIMSSSIQLEVLTKTTLHELVTSMKVSKGAYSIFYNHSGCYPPTYEGFKEKPIFEFEDLKQFYPTRQLILFQEEQNEIFKQYMRQNDIEVMVPLFVGDTMHGLLLLGGKLSGEIYSNQDINLLQIFGPEISIAIQNSKAYEEIKKFNVTLAEEVERATRQLQVANLKLKELDQLKDDFVSIASHELRTPMTAIKSYLWMALKRADIPLSEKMQRYLSRAYISTERLINLVNDMLNVSKIESGSIEINPKEFDITALANDAVQMFIPKASEKSIKIETLKEKIPNVFGDPDKITQVLLNLLGNALKFTPNGGIISISFFTDGKIVETSVKDSGVGISKEDLSRLFKKFGRLDNSYVAAATSGGTGLGLYISKSLIDLMGGKIWATSEGQGKGTTFIFSLPVVTPEILANAAAYTKKPIGETKSLEPVKI